MASSEVLSLHFRKYKYFAFSTVVLGYYIGLTGWPIGSRLLIDNVGYSQSMVILAAPQILTVIAGLSYYEPTRKAGELEQSCNGALKKGVHN